MKQFFKQVAATVVGIVVFGVIIAVFGLISLLGMVVGSDKPSLKDNSVLVVRLDDAIVDKGGDDDVLAMLKGEETNVGLNEILSAIKKAQDDDHIKGIYLEADQVGSDYATLQEIRNALADFRKKGKWIIAYGDAYSQGDYYVASVANKVYVNPQGAIALHGFSAQPMFYKDLFAKVGLKFTIVKVGTYKSAVEPLTEDKMRRLYDALPDAFDKPQYVTAATRLGYSPSTASKWINAFIAEGVLERKGQNSYAKVKLSDSMDSAAG